MCWPLVERRRFLAQVHTHRQPLIRLTQLSWMVVTDEGDGTYVVSYTSTVAGTHTVSGSIPGQATATLGTIIVEI